MGACVIGCSLTDIMTKAEMLQEQRDMLVIQLSLAEEEQAAATQAAAIASAEAQMQDKLREMLEVCLLLQRIVQRSHLHQARIGHAQNSADLGCETSTE